MFSATNTDITCKCRYTSCIDTRNIYTGVPNQPLVAFVAVVAVVADVADVALPQISTK